MMKRKWIFLLLVAMILFAVGMALAETDPIVCKMEVSPERLAAPGEVDVTITISNSGNTDMKDPLTLYDPVSKVVEDFGDKGSVVLKAGESKTWTGKWDVNQRTLDNGSVVFFVKYTLYKDSGEAYTTSQPIRGKISAQTAATGIEIKRTITPGAAREGQEVTVQYDIVNAGTVSLKNISIQENKSINSKAQSIKELKAGETAQIKFTVTMKKKDLTSSATITYTTSDSSKKQTETVEEQTITYGEPKMSAKLTSSAKGVAINGTVKLTLELKNNGNINYSDIRVEDKTLGEVFSNQKLDAGGSLTLEKEITLTETTDYQFTVTAIDNTGTPVTFTTDSLTLTAVDPNEVLHLTVEAGADRTEVYTSPGIVRFTVKVTNDSSVDAKDVSVYHGGTRIYTFASIPAGESRSLTRDAACSMAGKYQFTAATVDALDNTATFVSNEIQIAFSVPTPAPATATPPPVPTAEPTFQPATYIPASDPSIAAAPKMLRNIFYPLMIVGILLLVGALALLVVATKKRADQKKASDAAYDHLERVKRRDYIAPNEEPTPEPVAPAEAAKSPADAPEDDALDNLELPHMKYVRNAYQREGQSAQPSYRKSLYDDEPLTDAYADDLYEKDYDDAPAQASEPNDYADSDDLYARPQQDSAPYESDATYESDAPYDDGYVDQPDEYSTYGDDRYDDTHYAEDSTYSDGYADDTYPPDDYAQDAPADATEDRHRRAQDTTPPAGY